MTTLGVLGFAHAHVAMYCKQWAAMSRDRVRLVAGWDHDAERLRKACEPHGIEPHAELAALLARADIDAVVIASETNRHADLAAAAAAAGKAIVMQKPLALTLAEADRIVNAVKRHGVPFTLAWQMRVDPQNVRMREMVRGGELGRMFMLRRRHGLSCHLWAGFEKSWHVRPELNRGMWADDAAHAIDFIYWMLGEPVSVSAEIGTVRDPAIPDDHGIAVYRYADGAFAEAVSSFTCAAGENTTEIVCEKGVIIQNYGDVPSCNVPRPEGAPGLKWYAPERGAWVAEDIPTPAGHGERINALAGPLLEFLEGRRPPIATADEGRAVLRMVLASYRASELGRRVRLDEVD